MATVSVRYIVDDVDAAIAFYCRASRLPRRDASGSFVRHDLPGRPPTLAQCAEWARGGGGGGGQTMPDGRKPEPGGWNRISLQVSDLTAVVDALRGEGVHFRNDIVNGVGGRQILLDDPSGNPIELFEPNA